MVEFFVPEAENQDQAEKVWKETVNFIEELRGPVNRTRRIYSIEYEGNRDSHEVSIGEIVKQTGDPAIVILESEAQEMHFICTPSRGVRQGTPIMIANNDVINTEDFEDDSY